MIDQPSLDAVSRKTYTDMIKSFKTMNIGQKSTEKANVNPPVQHAQQLQLSVSNVSVVAHIVSLIIFQSMFTTISD
jgi:flagellar basal body rod protein FlgG